MSADKHIATFAARLEELRAHIDGRPLVASVSGGKDSSCVSLLLTEHGLEHERIFFDTGWEHPITLHYACYRDEAAAAIARLPEQWSKKRIRAFLDEQDKRYGREPLISKLGHITRLCAEETFAELCRRKGMFPSRTRRFCTEELKAKVALRYLDAIEDDPVNVIGIRHAESKRRSTFPEWEWADRWNCETWRPIIHWSFDDVIEMHARHRLHPNPLYLLGASRVGCWPCIFSRKHELRRVADKSPERIAAIGRLEADVQAAALARHKARGDEASYNPPTLFQAPIRNAEGRRPCMPIEEVVSWSRTARGGAQVELFAPGAGEEGCMRWGLCDLQPGDSDIET